MTSYSDKWVAIALEPKGEGEILYYQFEEQTFQPAGSSVPVVPERYVESVLAEDVLPEYLNSNPGNLDETIMKCLEDLLTSNDIEQTIEFEDYILRLKQFSIPIE